MKGDGWDATDVSDVKNDASLDQSVGGLDGNKWGCFRYIYIRDKTDQDLVI